MATQLKATSSNNVSKAFVHSLTDSTVKQERLSRMQWIRWSRGLPLDGDDDYRGSGR